MKVLPKWQIRVNAIFLFPRNSRYWTTDLTINFACESTNFAHARYKLNGCRQRLLFARQLTQRKCSPCSQGTVRQELQPQNESIIHQPIPLVPFHRELWGIWSRFRRAGRGRGLIFWYYTQGPGICLEPGQPCGRDLSFVWFQSRTWNRFEFMVMSISDIHCTSASGMHACTLAKCATYSWMWCEIQVFTCVLRQQVNK